MIRSLNPCGNKKTTTATQITTYPPPCLACFVTSRHVSYLSVQVSVSLFKLVFVLRALMWKGICWENNIKIHINGLYRKIYIILFDKYINWFIAYKIFHTRNSLTRNRFILIIENLWLGVFWQTNPCPLSLWHWILQYL